MIRGSYQRTETIHESPRSVIERGVRRSDGLAVVIKRAAPQVPPCQSLARLRNEWFICRIFDAPEVIPVLELIEDGNETALIFAGDDRLEALEHRGAAGPLGVRESVVVALGILDALAVIHGKSVVHKDIKPSNVLVDPELGRVVLIDFGIAVVVPRELGRSLIDSRCEGTLGYMPPEQTGRVSRAIDYRSDYYGLGATLYWMLAGERPFAELREPGELIHAQLTRVPALLSERRPEVPPTLARIVAKLLSKAAEDRYQGSFGLRADLRRCLAEIDGEPIREPFVLAAVDPCERLRQPRTLHGRGPQLARLLALHRRAVDRVQLALICGPSGSGKSALAQALEAELASELGGPAPAREPIVATCKFDPYVESSAHVGVGPILQRTLAQLVAGPPHARARLRERLREALGPNGALLRDIVPELEALLGPQAEPVAVGPGEARDRFRDTLERFAGALLLPERQFVWFVDDVQWADPASLRLLESLCLGPPRSLTLLLAARDDAIGVDAGHPLTRMLGELAQRGLSHERVELGPLSQDDVSALVADVLDGGPESLALAQLLHRRTQGTPLYVAQLLMAFYAEGIIDIDRTQGQWRVDLARANQRESSGDVIDFLIEQFAALPEHAQTLLGVAACVGARFDLETLAVASGQPVSSVGVLVWDAVGAGYLRPLTTGSGAAVWSGTTHSTGGPAIEYGFVHDRLRQVALEASDQDRPQLYLTLASRLAELAAQGPIPHETPNDGALGLTSATPSGPALQTLAGYIGRALELVHDPVTRRRFAALCIEAGNRAKQAAAYEAAALHHRHALALLDDEAFAPGARFDLCLAMAESLAMASAGGTKVDAGNQAKAAYQQARALIHEPVEHARLLLSEVTMAMIPGDTERALDLVIEAAARFDLDLRRGGERAWIEATMAAVLAQVAAVGLEAIPALPMLRDPLQIALDQLLLASTNAAYLAGDFNLYTALALTILAGGLRRGLSDVCGVAFVQIAIVFATSGEYESARRFSSVGLKILARFPGSPLAGMAQVIMGSTIHPWIEPMATCAPLMAAGHERLRSSGMVSGAGYAYFCLSLDGFMIGAPLPRVIRDAERTLGYLESIGDQPLAYAIRGLLAACEALAAGTDDGAALRIDPPSADEHNPAAHFTVHAIAAFSHTMLADEPEVAQAIAAMGPMGAAGTGLFAWAVFGVVSLLHACARYPDMDPDARARHQAEIEAQTAMLARWQSSCPENARPFVHLLAGAWAPAQGALAQARVEYTAAADAAETSGFHNFAGLANERGAAVILVLGDRRSALGYLEHARRSYGRWGARALERRVIGQLRALGYAPATAAAAGEQGTIVPIGDTIHALDVSSIVKMSLALSEVTHLDGVFAQLLGNASENAGADHSAILLLRDGTLELHADQVAGQGIRRFDPPLPLDEAGELLARAVVQDCLLTGTAVIIDDARAHPGLGDDQRAILALPVIKGGERTGVLYLENRVTPGAFTPQQLQVLTSLAVQAAISIDNALLFDALREREAQWRALVDSAPDSIVIVDPEHRIQFSNRRDLGDGSDAILGATLESFVAAGDRERVRAAIDYVFATGGYSSYELTRSTLQGERRFTTRLGPILRDRDRERGDAHDREREVACVTLISTDVTEQRALELQFRQSQKLQAVGTLASGVAHDFNNLLTVIGGACELGALELEDLGLPDHSPVAESLREIADAAERAGQLTRQLLAFSRKQVLQPKHVDLNALVGGIARMLSRLIGEDIQLELLLANERCGVFVDPGQLEQVVVNLVVNARDAMPQGGTVTISTSHVPGQPAPQVSLEIADTGTGMDLETQRRIFEPFFTTKDQGRGTGLGLSTVLGIVDQSGGQISVDSQLGVGTCIRVLLPADAGVGADAPATAPDAALPRGSERILIAEDDPGVLQLTAQVLRDLGYQVLIAGDGDEAVRVALHHPIDLLVSDLVMPGRNGPEVAREARARHPGIEVLYTSGYTHDALARLGVAEGSAAFLQKPFSRAGLAFEVRRLLDARIPNPAPLD